MDLDDITSRLAAAGCVAAEEEANDLCRHASNGAVLDQWVARRELGEPLAWIIGSIDFGGVEVSIWPGIFVPRPQSVTLAKRAAHRLPRNGRAIDLCTGSGAVAKWLAVRRTDASIVASDIEPMATECADRNGVPTALGDLDAPFSSDSIDLVTAVAPYVPSDELKFLPRDVSAFEPSTALDGGPGDGLSVVRRAVEGAARLLHPGGWLLLEVGGEQDRMIRPYLEDRGFGAVATWVDDDGDLRGIEARLGHP